MDMIAIIVSILSVFVSIILTKWQMIHERKINSLNLENEYFRQIFTKYMVEILPKKRNLITVLDGGQICEKSDLIKELHSLMKASVYYKYADLEFYDNLCISIQNLEDFLIENDYTDKFFVESLIDDNINKIYECLNNQYKGLQR